MKHLRNFFPRSHTKIFLLFLLYLLSRIFFINSQGVFFDSQEYINLFINTNYIQAIISGHYPPHEGYIILLWPVFHLAQALHLDGAYFVIIVQIIISFIALYCFYYVIAYVTDKRTALYSFIIASVTPLFWIINVTVMMENAYAFYFFVSLYLLVKYLEKNKSRFLHLSLFFYGMAIITQAMVALWVPVYLMIIFFKKKHFLLKILFFLIVYFLVFSISNVLFLSTASHATIQDVFHYYYLGKEEEFARLYFTFDAVLIIGRNFLIPLLRNNTILLTLLSLISLLILLRKNKQLFFFGVLWIIPAIYTNQWWDSLLNGRHALLTGFGFAFLTGYLLRSKPLLFCLFITYILVASLPALNLLRYPIPYIEEANYVKSLPKNALFIESHFARPQVQDTVKVITIYLNEPGYTHLYARKAIDTYLAKKVPVFISGAALTEPYGLFSGPYLHNITLSYAYPYELQTVIPQYRLKTYHILNLDDNLIIYQIISKNRSPYPPVKHLQNSYRRIDYTDPLSWIFRSIESIFSHQ